MKILRRLFQGVNFSMDPDKNRITSGPPRSAQEAKWAGLPYDGGSGGGGNQPPSGGGTGGGGRDSFENSPYKPTPKNIFRLMAFDHRTLSEVARARFEPNGNGTLKSGLTVREFEQRLDEEVRRRAPPPDVAYKIQKGIIEAARLANLADVNLIRGNTEKAQKQLEQSKAKYMEIEVALYFGPAVTNFGQDYDQDGFPLHQGRDKGTFPNYTEIDVQTDSYLIEVTIGESSKRKQISKYVAINSSQKHIILYAPNYPEGKKQREIEQLGGRVIRDFESLTSFLKGPL